MDEPKVFQPDEDSDTNSAPKGKPITINTPDTDMDSNSDSDKPVVADTDTHADSSDFGGNVRPADPPVDTGEHKESFVQPAEPKGGLLKNKKALIGVVVAVLLIAGGVAALIMNNNSTKTPLASTNTGAKKVIPVLRFGSSDGMISEFYPGSDSTSSASSTAIVRTVFEGLVAYDSNGHFAPLLADSWTNPDSSTWIFKLHPGVKFHDGTTMTAQIVKDSIMADTPNTELFGVSSTIKSIDVTDANTIKITTNNPDALLLNKLVNVFVYDTTGKTKNSPDNGTGPFVVKDGTTPSYDSVDLVQYSGYWGDKPLVNEIIGKSYDDDTAMVAAAKAGKIDVGFPFFDAQAKEISAADKDAYKFVRVDAAGAYDLSPLTMKTGSPVQKKDIRKAIYLTLDPNLIMKAAGKDGDAIGQVAPKNVSGYDPSITRPKQDIEAAKALVKSAGYPNGTTLSIFYGPPAEKTVHEIGTELAQIGITLTYHPVASFDEYTSNIKNTTYDLGYISNYSDISEISDIISTNLTKSGDFGTYDNPDVDKLLAQATQEFDTTQRIKLLQQASGLIMDDYGTIPIFVPNNQVLLRSNYNASFDIQDGEFGSYLSKFYMQ